MTPWRGFPYRHFRDAQFLGEVRRAYGTPHSCGCGVSMGIDTSPLHDRTNGISMKKKLVSLLLTLATVTFSCAIGCKSRGGCAGGSCGAGMPSPQPSYSQPFAEPISSSYAPAVTSTPSASSAGSGTRSYMPESFSGSGLPQSVPAGSGSR